jgi:hypothetical protein
VLVVGLVGIGPSLQEGLPRRVLFRDLVGVVVLHLVVVPRHDPRCGGVGGLQLGVGLVGGEPLPVVGQGDRFAPLGEADVAPVAHQRFVRGVLVDVVPDEQDEVGRLPGDLAVGGEVAVLVVGARGERKPQRVDGGADRRRRLRPADRAQVAAGLEPVEVLPPWLQAGHVDVDAVDEVRVGDRLPGLDDRAELVVVGHLPADRVRDRVHAAARDRDRRQPRPEDDPVRRRITGGDPEGEGVRPERRGPGGNGRRGGIGVLRGHPRRSPAEAGGDQAQTAGGAGQRQATVGPPRKDPFEIGPIHHRSFGSPLGADRCSLAPAQPRIPPRPRLRPCLGSPRVGSSPRRYPSPSRTGLMEC